MTRQETKQDQVAGMMGVDPRTRLKDTCIDAIGDIGSTDPSLVSKARNLLEKIASTDVSEYSRKKAQNTLRLIVGK